ncbi:MAG: hypothetical protein FWF25_01350 [Propionibacteriaceae bacterium]|nr:hypothetical protein [Propionibacteriaceae bacterium]
MMKPAVKLLIGLGGSLVPVIAGGLAVVLIIGGIAAASNSANSASSYSGGASSCAINPSALTLTTVGLYGRGSSPGAADDQLYNAAIIVSVGAQRGLSQRDQQTAVMVAMQESSLRNLDYGDADSLGLFQQRPSQGWGTADQVQDPVYAAGAFYDHLVTVTNRDSMTLNDVAQAVQASATPNAYGDHESEALAVVTAIYGDTSTVCTVATGDGMTLTQAVAFMNTYKSVNPADWDINSCGCLGGCLVNCVSVSIYFVNRYTTSHVTGATGNGRDVANNMIRLYGLSNGGHVPHPYAIFSKATGVTMCGASPCGHTGVVLGIDQVNNQIIIGEAGCGNPSFTGAHVYALSDWSTPAITYAYTDTILKGDPSVGF